MDRHNSLERTARLLRLEQAIREREQPLSAEHVRLLERFNPGFRERQIEAHHTGELVAVDTFFVGTLKGVVRVYLQSVIDCLSRCAWGRRYTSKLPLAAVHVLNNDVLPFYEQHAVRIETVLLDNGREDRHTYELSLQLEEIEHRITKVRRPQSNDCVKRLHRTLLDVHFRIKGREKWYESLEEMQADLDVFLEQYNTKRPHQGRGMNGRTPYQDFLDGIPQQETAKKEARSKPEKVAKYPHPANGPTVR